MRSTRSIGRFLARLLSLALLLGLFGVGTWVVAGAALQHHLAFDLLILAVGGIASVICWLSFPRALTAFAWSFVIGIGTTTVGVAVLFLTHLYVPALAAVYLAFCIAITPPLVRMTWSLRRPSRHEHALILSEIRPMNLLWRNFFLWELRHAPVEERREWLHRFATHTSEPIEAVADADDDEVSDWPNHETPRDGTGLPHEASSGDDRPELSAGDDGAADEAGDH